MGNCKERGLLGLKVVCCIACEAGSRGRSATSESWRLTAQRTGVLQVQCVKHCWKVGRAASVFVWEMARRFGSAGWPWPASKFSRGAWGWLCPQGTVPMAGPR